MQEYNMKNYKNVKCEKENKNEIWYVPQSVSSSHCVQYWYVLVLVLVLVLVCTGIGHWYCTGISTSISIGIDIGIDIGTRFHIRYWHWYWYCFGIGIGACTVLNCEGTAAGFHQKSPWETCSR